MCEECEWEELADEICEMLDDPEYEFALGTLEGIRNWIVKNEHCTEGQKEAVENITVSVEDR